MEKGMTHGAAMGGSGMDLLLTFKLRTRTSLIFL